MGYERLKNLEKEEKYVFHGSGEKIEEFEPRQAHTIINGEHVPDGKPAIFASPVADYAFFMAIVNKVNCPDGVRSGTSWSDQKIEFKATQKTLDQLNKDSAGYVYIFKRADFEARNSHEWVSHANVKPIEVIEVRWSDFPQKITVIPDEESEERR